VYDLGKVQLAKPTLIETEAPNDPERAFPKRALTCTIWLPSKNLTLLLHKKTEAKKIYAFC